MVLKCVKAVLSLVEWVLSCATDAVKYAKEKIDDAIEKDFTGW
jgi:hypothetical protein